MVDLLLPLQALYLFLPAFVGNMVPVFAAALFRRCCAWPVDFGAHFRGHRVTGDHKTWRGFVVAALGGYLIFLFQRWAFVQGNWFGSLSVVDYVSLSPWFGVVVAVFALVGDVVKSFVKRQVGVPPGNDWVPFDQVDFILGGLVGVWCFFVPSWPLVLWLVVLSFVLNYGVGMLGKPLKRIGKT